MYFWLFPWQPPFCSILPLFLYLGERDSTGSGCNKYGETILETSCFAKIVYGLSCVHGGHDLSWLCLGAMITHDCVLGP